MRNADNERCLLEGHSDKERADRVLIRKTVKDKRKLIEIPGIWFCHKHKATFKIIRKKELDLMVILDLEDEKTIKNLKPRTDLKNKVDVHYPFTC